MNTDKLVDALVELAVECKEFMELKTLRELEQLRDRTRSENVTSGSAITGTSVWLKKMNDLVEAPKVPVDSGSYSKPTTKLQKDQVLQFHVNSNSKLEWVIFKDMKNQEKDTPVVGCIHYVNQTDKDVILTIGIEYK